MHFITFTASNQLLHMTTATPVIPRGKSSTVARSPKKCRLTTAPEAATAVEKEESVLNVTEAVECWHLSPEAVAA